MPNNRKYNLTVSPDFKPDRIAGWYIFNTWLQKKTGLDIHLELYDNFEEQRSAIRNQQIDLIYANPFDTAMLVRELDFKALVKPADKADEAVIVCCEDNPANCIEDLREGCRIIATDDPDINMIGMRMIEPADLDDSNTTTTQVANYVVLAKRLISGDADIGFFLKEAYDDLTNITKRRLKVLVTSQISVIYHSVLAAPSLADQYESLSQALLNINTDAKGPGVLDALGIKGFEAMSEEDAEFMIDLMETLRD